MNAPTLLILAAGMGSRYGGLKQIDAFGPHGETILDYSVYDALRAGFGKVVFVIRRQIEQAFREAVGSRFEGRVAVEYVFQELDQLPSGFTVPAGRTKPWGTVHAVLAAAEAIREPFAVINADDFYGAEGYQLLARHLQSGTPDYAMAGFILRNTLSEFGKVARGICQVSEDGYLRHIVEMTGLERSVEAVRSLEAIRNEAAIRNVDAAGTVTALTGEEAVSLNMWAFQPRVFEGFQTVFERFLAEHGSETGSECYLPNGVHALIDAGEARVRVLPTHSEWLGVTYREDRAHVSAGIQRMIREGRYPERLWT